MSPPDGPACGACAEPLTPTARFCPGCGAPVVQTEETQVRKFVTLLFCDVTGSTALGERLDPEALRTVMGRYFTVAREAIERHGGTVEKFVGDAVLAVFGIPEVREDDPLRAVRAAAEMRDALAALGAELRAGMGVELQVRTGVNSGSVVAGAPRAGGSFATGDAVNTAARLEQAAAPGEVLLGEETWALVRDAVEVEPIAPLTARGKAEPLAAYRLVRVLDAERGRSRRLDGPLVGRAQELRALRDALDRTVSLSRGQLVTVLGAAGMGKTRLLDALLGELGPEVRVLRGRCLSYGRGITFWPVVQLLHAATGLTGREGPDDTEAAAREALAGCPDADAVLLRLLPLLGLGGEPGGADETFWAVRSFFEHLALARPLLLVVDDLHWAEPTLLDLLERLRDEARDVPLMLLCQARPELLEERPGWGGGALNATTFSLEPLTPAQTASLVGELAGPGVPEPVLAAIERWADGNPLFVEELTEHLLEEGLLRRDEDGWRVTGDLSSLAVPATVHALLAARLERLPAAERALLERISVVGLELTVEQARRLAPEGADAPALLSSLGRRDLLRRTRGERPDTWAFRHVLLREAAYGALPKALRAELHERMADELQVGASDAGSETAAFVGHHLEQAVAYRQELGTGAPEVLALAERAATVLGHAARAAQAIDDLTAGIGLAQRALRLCQGDDQRRLLLWQLYDLQHDEGRFTDALDTLSLLGKLIGSADEEHLVLQAQLLALRSEVSEAVDPTALLGVARRATELARGRQDDAGVVRALWAECTALGMLGLWLPLQVPLQEITRYGGPAGRRARVVLLIAHVFGPPPAEIGLQYAATLREPGTPPRLLAMVLATEAALLAHCGRAEESRATALECERLSAGLGGFTIGVTSTFLAEAHRALFDGPASLRALERGIEELMAGGGTGFASTHLALKAMTLLELPGREREAREVVARAAEMTSSYDVLSVAMVACCRAVLACRAGEAAEAARQAALCLSTIAPTDQLTEQGDVRRLLAELPRRGGDVAGERELLTEAAECYRRKGHQPFLSLTEDLLAALPE